MTLTPDLQRDLVEGLRAAVENGCLWCKMGHPLEGETHVWTVDRLTYCAGCQATAERALLARVDAEIAAIGANYAE